MRKARFGTIAALALGGLAVGAATSGAAPRTQGSATSPQASEQRAVDWRDPPLSADWAKWNRPVPPRRIAGNLYAIGAANVASYAIDTKGGIVVIDTGFGQTVPQLVANLRALRLDPGRIRLILISHAHVDHVGGVAALKAMTGAAVAASAADAALLQAGGKGDFAFDDDLPYRPVRADRILRDGEVVTLGGQRLTAHVTPGHTRGCTTWSFQVDDDGTARDVLFPCGTSAPGYDLVDNRRWPGITAAYRRSFARMAAMRCDIVLAGHPESIDLEGRAARGALVDRAHCARTIETARIAFEREVARQRAGGTVGAS